MQNSLVLFTFSVLEQKYPFWANLTPKKSSCQFKLKFGTQTNSSFQNSAGVFSFSVLDWKHSFWANLVQIVKIISLSLNLVPRLIRICRIQWWCSLFLLYTGSTLFGKRRQTKHSYCLCDFTGVETLKQADVVNTDSFFVLLRCTNLD